MNKRPLPEAQRVEAIVFDLDDTIVDTFKLLIEPLESEAATAMLAASTPEADAGQITELILRLRRDAPERVDELLAQNLPWLTEEALEARRSVFAHASLDNLHIEPPVREMLQELSTRYDTYLLTVGRADFQNRKLDRLSIRGLFKAITVLPPHSEETKERWLSSLTGSGYRAESVIVVGNRLDNEIRAGNRLGMVTVWVRRGEGSGLVPCDETGEPDYVISDIAEFPEILAKIESSRQRLKI
ncbi:MAG TPA: HAD hydrolase-like protein [Pyrinomonadaceae bacterium]|jgi:putative hydrolase of the HAD superfamily